MDVLIIVPIDETYRTSDNLLATLMERKGVMLAGTRMEGEVPYEITRYIQIHHPEARLIVANKNVPRGGVLSEIPKDAPFPFCSLWKSNQGKTFLSKEEALVSCNYFLCIERENPPLEKEPSEDFRTATTHEYKCHVNPETFSRWHTKYPAYVNLDRDSDNIGGSSWDGNLVSWFHAGFGSRIQYAIQSGLFPTEE